MTHRRRLSGPSPDRWLISYADFITLLFAFFVVLYGVAQSDRAKTRDVSESVKRAFGGPAALARFVFAMSSGTGRLFADPEFFSVFRSRVVPLLRTYSFARIWVPHCGRGEDAYSLAAII